MIIETTELSRRTGATARQLHHWVNREIIQLAEGTEKLGPGISMKFDNSIVKKVKFLVEVSEALRKITLKSISDMYDEGEIWIGENLILNWES